MPKRIDLDSGDGGSSNDELEKALRQLQQPKKKVGEDMPREEVQAALREIREQQKTEAAARKPQPKRPRWVVWSVLGGVVLVAVVLAIIFTRPAPLPPLAGSPQDAVSGFWRSLIDGQYEAATVYYPAMVEKYGSRKQAAEFLREHFSTNPPVQISKVGEPEEVPDSSEIRVTYEVYMRSGTPRSGDAIVSGNGAGYVIVAGI